MNKIGEYNGVFSYLNTHEDENQNVPNYIKNIYTGTRWQCVEFVRRYFILVYGLTFPNVKNVYEMMSNQYFYNIYNHNSTQVNFFREMMDDIPKKDDIIYIKKDKTDHTGHVGIVCHYDDVKENVYIADQNGEKGISYWEHNHYAKILHKNDPSIIGWSRVI